MRTPYHSIIGLVLMTGLQFQMILGTPPWGDYGEPALFQTCKPGENYIPDDNDCTRFWNCTGGDAEGIPSRCPLGLFWNQIIEECDFPSAVPHCGQGGIPTTAPTTPTTTTTTTTSTTTTTTTPVKTTRTMEPLTTESTPETTEPPIDCESVEFGFIPHHDCTKYYNCTNFVGHVNRCELGLHWNPRINECDFPSHVPECEGGTRPPITDRYYRQEAVTEEYTGDRQPRWEQIGSLDNSRFIFDRILPYLLKKTAI